MCILERICHNPAQESWLSSSFASFQPPGYSPVVFKMVERLNAAELDVLVVDSPALIPTHLSFLELKPSRAYSEIKCKAVIRLIMEENTSEISVSVPVNVWTTCQEVLSLVLVSWVGSFLQFHDAVICGVHVFKLYKPSLLKEPLWHAVAFNYVFTNVKWKALRWRIKITTLCHSTDLYSCFKVCITGPSLTVGPACNTCSATST